MNRMEKKGIETLKKLKEKYSNYDFSNSSYKCAKSPISFFCKKHGIVSQRPNDMLNGHGCKFCGNENKNKNRKHKSAGFYFGGRKPLITKEKFLEVCSENHEEKYTYFNLEEIGTKSLKNINLDIQCECGNRFVQNAYNHYYRGFGCKICAYKKSSKKRMISLEEFISKAKKVHGDKYNYSLVEYNGDSKKVKIICSKHGIFNQTPNAHVLRKNGCPHCKESFGEKTIRLYCEEQGIKYITQKRYEDCRDVIPLPFDFLLPDKNILIEFQGEQHFHPIKKFGGKKGFEYILKHDEIKRKWAKSKGFHYLELTKADLKNLNDILK